MLLKLVLFHLVVVAAGHSCSENCLKCVNDSKEWKCSSCKDGFYNGYYLGFYKRQCGGICPDNCIRCKEFDECYTCKDGFYIRNNNPSSPMNIMDCSLACPKNCKTCTSYKQCSACINSFYIGTDPSTGRQVSDCTLPCPKRCVSCSAHDLCTSCTANFVGNACNECADRKHGQDCKLDCPEHCKQCSSLHKCTSCVEGFYNVGGSHTVCEHRCHENCLSCDSATHCQTCKSGFYSGFDASNNSLDDCSLACPSKCKKCVSRRSCSECHPGYSGYLCKRCPNGFYGDGCTNMCRNTCVSCTSRDSCTSCIQGYNGTSCEICVDGKYGTNCDMDCPDSCQTCTSPDQCQVCMANYSGTMCQNCITGKYGDYCDSNCPPNCYHGACVRETGACSTNRCASNFYGPYCNQSCENNCMTCISFENCIDCKTGKYGNTCTTDCPSTCKNRTCTKETGHCITCLDGYYGNKCENKCSENCTACISSENCTSCKLGLKGQTCTEICGHCRIGTGCGIADGVCANRCENGFFGPKCTLKCSNECETCKISPSYCVTCIKGKYGKHPRLKMIHYICDRDCPVNCMNRSCDRESGNCFACVDGYKGIKCDCPEHCETCLSPYVCSSCKAGYAKINMNCECQYDMCTIGTCKTCTNPTWFPDNATRACCKCNRNCLNRECTSEHRCLHGCIAGHYGEACDKLCSAHDQTCVECKSNDDVYSGCVKCKDGLYPNSTNGECIPCHETCDNRSCSSVDGHCTKGCLNLTWGERCDKDCPEYCLMCDRDTGHCLKCREENYLIDCSEDCNSNCNINDRRHLLCTANSSRCVHICSDGCIQKECDIDSGECTLGCAENYFGNTCGRVCSDNCGNVTFGRICSESNGTCVNGCKARYFGPSCVEECSVYCVKGICHGPEGDCTFGCTNSYKGRDCARDTGNGEDEMDNTRRVIVVAGGISGAALAVVMVFVIVMLLRKRSQNMKKDRDVAGTLAEAEAVELEEVIQGLGDENGPVYSNLSDADALNVTSGRLDAVLGNLTDDVPAADPIRCMPERDQVHHQSRSLEPADDSHSAPMPNQHSNMNSDSRRNTPLYANYTGDTTVDMEEEEIGEDTVIPVDEANVDKEIYYNTFSPLISVEKLPYYVAHKPLQEYAIEFQQLPRGLIRPYADSVKPKNIPNNRYRDIFPYDGTRVRLSGPGNDYINASYIDGFEKERAYIACLGPTVTTTAHFVDFWVMVWQQRVEKIVMLTNLVEHRVMKCEKYWPEHGTSKRYGDVRVTCHSEDVYAEYTVRTFTAAKGTDRRSLHHIHFTAWPDKGVPDDVTGLIEFRQKVESCETKGNAPMIVHCSAGIGRTGTYIALDILTRIGKKQHAVNIYGCLTKMREQRIGMVQTCEQYRYLHEAVVHALTFDCDAIQGERFQKRLVTMGDSHLEAQFELLQRTCAYVSAEEASAVESNMSYDASNRSGVNVSGDLYRPRLIPDSTGGRSNNTNAVYVNSFKRANHYITIQTPLPRTVTDFLALVEQCDCVCVISLDSDQTAKYTYLPRGNETVDCGPYRVTSQLTETSSDYIVRKLRISRQGDGGPVEKTLSHFQLTQWPDTVPTPRDAGTFVEFVKKVESSATETDPNGRILVHCLTGAERSGLFCVVSVLIQKMEIEHQVSVVNTVRQVKARRKRAIPNKEQFLFCHQCVDAYLKTFETYSNFTV